MPSEWIGVQPAMILFNRITDEHNEQINSFNAIELERSSQVHNQATEIISRWLSDSTILLDQYPEISEVFREISLGSMNVERLRTQYRIQREQNEAYQSQVAINEQEKRQQAEENYRNYVYQERRKNGLKYGVPPVNTTTCPAQFPIRATANISDARGIYYYIDERSGVEVYWCFASEEEAQAENFRRPYKNPPKQQPQ